MKDVHYILLQFLKKGSLGVCLGSESKFMLIKLLETEVINLIFNLCLKWDYLQKLK